MCSRPRTRRSAAKPAGDPPLLPAAPAAAAQNGFLPLASAAATFFVGSSSTAVVSFEEPCDAMNTGGQVSRSTRTRTGPAAFPGPLGPTSWDRSLAALNSFVKREGHAMVPQTHVEDGHRLGQWVAAQRQARRRGDLGDRPAAVLEALPGWSWDASRSRWHTAFAVLGGFVKREGHAPYRDDMLRTASPSAPGSPPNESPMAKANSNRNGPPPWQLSRAGRGMPDPGCNTAAISRAKFPAPTV